MFIHSNVLVQDYAGFLADFPVLQLIRMFAKYEYVKYAVNYRL